MDSGEVSDEKEKDGGGPEMQVTLPESVVSRIEELMGGTDEFDSADFDAVSYINRLFPTEQSLAGVEAAAARCEFGLAAAATAARKLLREQQEQRDAGHKALLDAQKMYKELALQITEINKKAERSESMVRSITSEMKQLDCAKWNLTTAITTLTHYRMLQTGGDALAGLCAARQYREIVPTMQASVEVLEHLSRYSAIPELASLRAGVHALRDQLAEQILHDFRQTFTAGGTPVSHRTLSEACGVVDVLEPRVRRELLAWFTDTQLQEYKLLFSPEQEASWLSHVERRYAWLKKHLLAFEASLGAIFPPHWAVSQRLAARFCVITREALSALMSSRRAELDVNLLLFAIQKTTNFEQLLEKRFAGTEPMESTENTKDKKKSDINKNLEEGGCAWVGAISSCFEPHLPIYIDSLDRTLRALMDTLMQEAKGTDVPPASSAPPAAPAAPPSALSGCARLLALYKQALLQCTRLSTGHAMCELCTVFQKYLSEYATVTLPAWLPRAGGGGLAGVGGGMPALVTNLHTLLRDEAHTRYTKQETTKITDVITTAEYCLESTIHLEQKLKEKVTTEFVNKIDLTPEQDLFHKTISNCIQLLVQDLELACEPALQSMTKISWLHFDNVGDQSSYVTQIIMHLKNFVPNLRDELASSRKYFTQFCIRFANSFIPKFIQNVYKCKPISTVGSEQLLLDTHMLKTALLELPSIGSEVKRPAPATYTKVVIKLMSKAEMILKLVMAPLDGNLEGFVQQFAQLLPESTVAEFHKVLDMKGAKLSKTQITNLDAIFKKASKSSELH